ncbi:MAG TPA: PAS domain S-box protein [Anaeromyxobacter sp.]|nr:PAS domain S-box protein [Anaeromyxobacter sp.]
MSAGSQIEQRIALLAPSARDGPVTANVLARAGFDCALARDGLDLVRLLEEGAAAALVAQEALAPATVGALARSLGRQEPWSDMPVIVLTTGATRREGPLATAEGLAPLGNVTLLDRPIEVITLVSAVGAASRARRRQYAARAALAEMDAILQAIPFAVYFGDEHGITRCNAEALRMLGASSLDDLRRRIGELAAKLRVRHERDGRLVEPERLPFQRALAGEVASLDMWAIRVSTGEDVLIRGNAAPVVVAGSAIGAVAVDIDITDQWRLLEELRASEARFRAMADGTPVIIWVTDAAGAIEFVNRAYCEFFGTTLEAVRSRGWQAFLDPDDAPAYVGAFARASAQREPFHAEVRVKRADGAWRWIESYGVPRLSPAGEFLGYAGSSPDITERRNAEESLRRSETLFRTVSDANLIGVGFADASGRLTHVNDELLRMMGYTRADFEAGGIDLTKSVAPEFAESVRRTIEELSRTGVSVGYERAFLRPDGGRTPYIGAAALVDRSTGLQVSVALDLTVQKQAEAELREADRQKTAFLGVLSHELRNPLAPIRNSVYLLEHGDPGGEQAVRARRVIERQAAHLARLVDDLLDVTRIERGKIELRRSRLDAREVVRRTCEDLRGLFEARGIELDLRLSRPAWIDADPTRVAQMVGNLLQNAAKFSRRGQAVTVSVSATDAAAEIRVRDEGAGIAPELLPRLFTPFVQGDGGISRAQGGLGLGLALVKGLAELHGGTVRARSEGVGRGAELLIELPLAPVQAAPARESRSREPGPPLAVLVIDDNLDGAQTLADVIALEGHRTEVATDGRSGIAKARERRPDVILCDIGLPDVDGFEVARALRADPALGSARLVALSGYAQPEDRQRALEAGFDAHVAKPPSPEELLRAITAGRDGSGEA